MIKQPLTYLRHHLANIDALTSCGGSLLTTGRTIDQKLLVVCELVRQQTILYHSESKSIPERIVCISQAHVNPIVCGQARPNGEFGANISISVSGDGLSFVDRFSLAPYLKVKI